MKKCPYCGELIQDSAIKCRYCGEWLVDRKSINKSVENVFHGDYKQDDLQEKDNHKVDIEKTGDDNASNYHNKEERKNEEIQHEASLESIISEGGASDPSKNVPSTLQQKLIGCFFIVASLLVILLIARYTFLKSTIDDIIIQERPYVHIEGDVPGMLINAYHNHKKSYYSWSFDDSKYRDEACVVHSGENHIVIHIDQRYEWTYDIPKEYWIRYSTRSDSLLDVYVSPNQKGSRYTNLNIKFNNLPLIARFNFSKQTIFIIQPSKSDENSIFFNVQDKFEINGLGRKMLDNYQKNLKKE